MPTWMIILGIFLFAIVTAFLYLWGLNKSLNRRQNLSNMLYNKCANKVIGELKKKNTITIDEVKYIIDGVKASEFYSRQKAVIVDPKAYSKQLVKKMCEQNLIKKDNKSNKYILCDK